MERFRKTLALCLGACGVVLFAGTVAGQTPANAKMMKTGKHMGVSREVQPPMPWPWYGKAGDEDLKAVFTYLKSIPPIVNYVPDWQPPAPAKAAPKKPAPAKK